MKNTKESELKPSFRRSAMSTIKGIRTRHVITLSPNKVNPGEELYIDIPMLSPESCLVPGRCICSSTLRIVMSKVGSTITSASCFVKGSKLN